MTNRRINGEVNESAHLWRYASALPDSSTNNERKKNIAHSFSRVPGWCIIFFRVCFFLKGKKQKLNTTEDQNAIQPPLTREWGEKGAGSRTGLSEWSHESAESGLKDINDEYLDGDAWRLSFFQVDSFPKSEKP